MRRTFQDLARMARVSDLVTRAVSGHATDSMQQHYSTVAAEEMRDGMGKVVEMTRFREALAVPMGTPDGAGGVQGGVPTSEESATEAAG